MRDRVARFRPARTALPSLERDESEVEPPQSIEVEAVRRVVLYAADGTPLVRLAGFTRSGDRVCTR